MALIGGYEKMNLRDIIEVESGVSFTRTSNHDGGEWHSACPWCGGEDRFMVWAESDMPSYLCRRCERSGDAYQFLKEYCHMTHKEIMQYLHRDDKPKVRAPKPAPEAPNFTSAVAFNSANKDTYRKAVLEMRYDQSGQDWFKSFGIDWNFWGIGSDNRGWLIPHWFTAPDGSKFLKAIKLRFRYPTKIKYINFPGGKSSGVFNDHLVNAPDGSRKVSDDKPLIIVEAEKDAMLLCELGYDTIAYTPEKTWDYYLPVIVGNRKVLVWADNDMPGKDRAQRVAKAIKRDVKIVSLSDEKQPTDLVKRLGMKDSILYITELVESWLM